jgi:hypothetical protein
VVTSGIKEEMGEGMIGLEGLEVLEGEDVEGDEVEDVDRIDLVGVAAEVEDIAVEAIIVINITTIKVRNLVQMKEVTKEEITMMPATQIHLASVIDLEETKEAINLIWISLVEVKNLAAMKNSRVINLALVLFLVKAVINKEALMVMVVKFVKVVIGKEDLKVMTSLVVAKMVMVVLVEAGMAEGVDTEVVLIVIPLNSNFMKEEATGINNLQIRNLRYMSGI